MVKARIIPTGPATKIVHRSGTSSECSRRSSYACSDRKRREEINQLIYSFVYVISVYCLPLMYQELCYLLW